MKYVVGILIGIALKLYIALGSMGILMMLIHPTHDHGMEFTYLWSGIYLLQFLPSVSYNFPCTSLLHPWLGLFLGILFFLKQL